MGLSIITRSRKYKSPAFRFGRRNPQDTEGKQTNSRTRRLSRRSVSATTIEDALGAWVPVLRRALADRAKLTQPYRCPCGAVFIHNRTYVVFELTIVCMPMNKRCYDQAASCNSCTVNGLPGSTGRWCKESVPQGSTPACGKPWDRWANG